MRRVAPGVIASLLLSCGGEAESGGSGPGTPTLVIDSLQPDSAIAGQNGFALTLYGQHFIAGTTVDVNGAPRAAVAISSTLIFANLFTADLAQPGTLAVRVSALGATTSAAKLFRVVPPTP